MLNTTPARLLGWCIKTDSISRNNWQPVVYSGSKRHPALFGFEP
ncbi:hypothetical protein [Marinomonas algicola]|nr:hypothetical protein [Marinomonas algicola]